MDSPIVRCAAGPSAALRRWQLGHLGLLLSAFFVALGYVAAGPTGAALGSANWAPPAHARVLLPMKASLHSFRSRLSASAPDADYAGLPQYPRVPHGSAPPPSAPLSGAATPQSWAPLGAALGLGALAVLGATALSPRPAPYVILATSSEPSGDVDTGSSSGPAPKKRSPAALLHPLLFTLFLAQAYAAPSPVAPLLPEVVWRWLHLGGGMLFGGLVCSSTLYESLVITQGSPEVRKWWFDRVGQVDKRALFPVLGIAVVSGVCLSQAMYGPLKAAPLFVPLSLEALVLFGAYWAFLDRRTQKPAQEQCRRDFEAFQRGEWQPGSAPAPVLQRRLRINLGSCAAVAGLYWIMVAKPAFDFLSLFS